MGWQGVSKHQTPTDHVSLRCHGASPTCVCCGCGAHRAEWSGLGPGVIGGMDLGWVGGSVPPAHPLHLRLPRGPCWDVLPTEWRDALLVKKEDGEFW